MNDISTEQALISPFQSNARPQLNQKLHAHPNRSLMKFHPALDIIETIENVPKLFDMCLQELYPSTLISSV